MQIMSTTVQNVLSIKKIKVLIDFLCGSSLFFFYSCEVSKQPTSINKWVALWRKNYW